MSTPKEILKGVMAQLESRGTFDQSPFLTKLTFRLKFKKALHEHTKSGMIDMSLDQLNHLIKKSSDETIKFEANKTLNKLVNEGVLEQYEKDGEVHVRLADGTNISSEELIKILKESKTK